MWVDLKEQVLSFVLRCSFYRHPSRRVLSFSFAILITNVRSWFLIFDFFLLCDIFTDEIERKLWGRGDNLHPLWCFLFIFWFCSIICREVEMKVWGRESYELKEKFDWRFWSWNFLLFWSWNLIEDFWHTRSLSELPVWFCKNCKRILKYLVTEYILI